MAIDDCDYVIGKLSIDCKVMLRGGLGTAIGYLRDVFYVWSWEVLYVAQAVRFKEFLI